MPGFNHPSFGRSFGFKSETGHRPENGFTDLPDSGGGGDTPVVTSYLLTETGEAFLTESGDHLIYG
jgi:hypothetical protein